jgi:ABC-type multidrug transport system fused ATPase/permease subunit
MPPLLNRSRRRALLGVFLLLCLEGGAAGLAALATRELFRALSREGTAPAGWLATLALSGLLIGLFRLVSRGLGERCGQDYVAVLRKRLFTRAARCGLTEVSNRRAGYQALRFVGDMSAFRNWLALGLPRLLASAVLLPTTLGVLAWLHPPFLWAVLPLYLVALLLIGMGGARLQGLQRAARASRARMAADMSERMPLAPLLERLGRAPAEVRLIRQRSAEVRDTALARVRAAEMLRAVPDLMSGLAAAALVGTAAATHSDTASTAAGLAALGIAMSPLRNLSSVWDHWAAYGAAREKCARALSPPGAPIVAGDGVLPPGPVSLRIDAVAVADSTLSARIEAGERVRLTGPPGTGKERLILAVAGLDHLSEGTVQIADTPLAGISRGSLRHAVVLLSDQPVVLRGSLRRALCLGLRERPADDEINSQAALLGLDYFLHSVGGLDCRLQEGARNLSRAKRIQLGILQAALARPGLLLVHPSVFQLDGAGLQALRALLYRDGATLLAIDPHCVLGMDYDREISMHEADAADTTARCPGVQRAPTSVPLN